MLITISCLTKDWCLSQTQLCGWRFLAATILFYWKSTMNGCTAEGNNLLFISTPVEMRTKSFWIWKKGKWSRKITCGQSQDSAIIERYFKKVGGMSEKLKPDEAAIESLTLKREKKKLAAMQLFLLCIIVRSNSDTLNGEVFIKAAGRYKAKMEGMMISYINDIYGTATSRMTAL